MTREEALRYVKSAAGHLILTDRKVIGMALLEACDVLRGPQPAPDPDTALTALRDMLKRREGCYACREEQPYCDDSGWWAMYEGDTLRLSAKGDEHCIASPFCINCGRQLAKEGGDETKSVEVEG